MPPKINSPCSVEGCARPYYGRGLCKFHYNRRRVHGTTFLAPAPSDAERFWSKVDPCRSDGCALWIGAVQSNGYGSFRLNGKTTRAHQFLVGKAPEGTEWDHVKERGCTHKNCVWPEHLEAVTHRVNLSRAPAAMSLRTHCLKGHPYDDVNTRVNKAGRRECITCNRASMRAYRLRLKQAADHTSPLHSISDHLKAGRTV